MLTFLLIISISSFFYSYLLFPFLLFFTLLYYLTSFDLLFIFDEVSSLILLISVFVILISFFSIKNVTKLHSISLILLFLFCFFVFSSNNALILFFFYEASLFPILYIIIKWGSYPERSLSSIILLIYTMAFTLPFLYILFFIYSSFYTFYYPSLYLEAGLGGVYASLIIFLAFSVKLPIYGLHFWLPIAHVEAPTFGSMILAGILLKLGGVGLIRFMPIFEIVVLRYLLLAYSVIFLLFSTLVCCAQSDFKRLIAYSSVNHIIALVPLVIINTDSSITTMCLLMLFHGVSSPLLFFLVGSVYELNSSRQLTVLRGVLIFSPILALSLVYAFLFTLSAPPFPSFISEVYFIISSLSLSFLFLPSLLLFAFFSLVYNLNWISTLLFNPHNPTSNFQIFSLKSMGVVFMAFMFTLVFTFYISFSIFV